LKAYPWAHSERNCGYMLTPRGIVTVLSFAESEVERERERVITAIDWFIDLCRENLKTHHDNDREREPYAKAKYLLENLKKELRGRE
jgi:hypothetical protein